MPFAKGKSGNPAGRPKASPYNLRALCEQYTGQAVAVLRSIMADEEAPHAARVKAAEAILDRAYGKPTQSLEVTQHKAPDDYTRADLLAIALGCGQAAADDRRSEGKPN